MVRRAHDDVQAASGRREQVAERQVVVQRVGLAAIVDEPCIEGRRRAGRERPRLARAGSASSDDFCIECTSCQPVSHRALPLPVVVRRIARLAEHLVDARPAEIERARDDRGGVARVKDALPVEPADDIDAVAPVHRIDMLADPFGFLADRQVDLFAHISGLAILDSLAAELSYTLVGLRRHSGGTPYPGHAPDMALP